MLREVGLAREEVCHRQSIFYGWEPWNPTLAASEFSECRLCTGGKDGAPGFRILASKDASRISMVMVGSLGLGCGKGRV
jgi:hypothetical protein